MNGEIFIKKLRDTSHNLLGEPFPYEATRKLQNDLSIYFLELSEELCFNADINTYFMNIDGCIDYIISRKRIPNNQLEMLYQSFFELFPEYLFIKEHLRNYTDLESEFNKYDYARTLIIEYVNLN